MGISGVGSGTLVQLQEPLLGTRDTQGVGRGPGGVAPPDVGDVRQRGSQLVGRPPLSSLRDDISLQERDLGRAIGSWKGTARGSDMPRSVGVVVPPGNRSVQLDGKMMEAEIKSLPRGRRREAVGNMPRVLQERVKSGYDLYQAVRAGTAPRPATMENIRDLMTFLTAKAGEKSSSFSEGAFSIEDPGHRLRDFLDSSTEMYQRPSSHIPGFRDAVGGAHRGIDMDGVSLPFGKATLLYGALNNGVEGMQGDRLFVKMESHGCRLTAGKAQNRDAGVHADRPMKFFRDLGQTLGHALGFFKTALRGLSGGRLFPNAPDSRKERMPEDVKSSFKGLVARFQAKGDEITQTLLSRNDPTSKSRGIRTMVENLDAAIGSGRLTGEDLAAVKQLRDELGTRFDHLDVRIGNEMILDQAELDGDQASSVKGQVRGALNTLLSVGDQGELTGAKLADFTRQLGRMALGMERSVDTDGANRMIRDAVREATANLSDGQKARLRDLLSGDQVRSVMVSTLDMTMAPEELDGLTDVETDSAIQGAKKIYQGFMELCQAVGADEPDLGGVGQEGKGLAKEVLTDIGRDGYIAKMSVVAKGQQEARTELRDQRVGTMSLATVRTRVGAGVSVLGSRVEGMMEGRVDQRQLRESVKTELGKELTKSWSTGYRGIPNDFQRDFFRRPLKVDGQSFGGRGGVQKFSEEEQHRMLDAFIDAVGGEKNAQKVATMATQNVTGLLTAGVLPSDPAIRPVMDSWNAMHGGMIEEDANTLDVEIRTTPGDATKLSVHVDVAQQRNVGSTGDEMGLLMTADYSLSGLDTEAPSVSVQRFDFLVSSNPPA